MLEIRRFLHPALMADQIDVLQPSVPPLLKITSCAQTPIASPTFSRASDTIAFAVRPLWCCAVGLPVVVKACVIASMTDWDTNVVALWSK